MVLWEQVRQFADLLQALEDNLVFKSINLGESKTKVGFEPPWLSNLNDGFDRRCPWPQALHVSVRREGL